MLGSVSNAIALLPCHCRASGYRSPIYARIITPWLLHRATRNNAHLLIHSGFPSVNLWGMTLIGRSLKTSSTINAWMTEGHCCIDLLGNKWNRKSLQYHPRWNWNLNFRLISKLNKPDVRTAWNKFMGCQVLLIYMFSIYVLNWSIFKYPLVLYNIHKLLPNFLKTCRCAHCTLHNEWRYVSQCFLQK